MDIKTYLAINPKYKEVFDLMSDEEKQKLVAAFGMVSRLVENLVPICKELAKSVAAICRKIIAAYPNKRVVHLAFHGKKKRTRKKNMHRILKDVQKWKRRENGE